MMTAKGYKDAIVGVMVLVLATMTVAQDPQMPTVEGLARKIKMDPHLSVQGGPRVYRAAPWTFVTGSDRPLYASGHAHEGFGAFFQVSHVRSLVAAGGSYCAGKGEAWDEGLQEVMSQVAGEGYGWSTWRYVGDRIGDAEVDVVEEIVGVFGLVDNDAAGFALGFCEFQCTVIPTLEVHLELSCAESASGLLAPGVTVPVGKGAQVSMGFGVSIGEGDYWDYSVNHGAQIRDCDRYFVQHRTRAAIKVWANGAPPAGRGECRARMVGYIDSTTVLGDHP